jgi:hypothetical protein
MVVCEKCNAENTISAVHCVKCGVLLSHFNGADKPAATLVKNDTTSWCYSNHDLGSVIFKSIIGVSVYLLILLSVLIFWPDVSNHDIGFDKANQAFKKVKVANHSRTFRLQCTEKELGAIIRLGMSSFFVQGASWGGAVPRDVSARFKDTQHFDLLVTYYLLNGYLPFSVVYTVKLPTHDQPPHGLSITNVSIGLLPASSSWVKAFTDSANVALERSKFSTVLSRIKWGKIDHGVLTVYSYLH